MLNEQKRLNLHEKCDKWKAHQMIPPELHVGDSREVLEKLANDPRERRKYRVIVTSPPYYGHRHYGEDHGELGQEKTDEQFINNLAEIFVTCRELLTDDGSLWIVIGDTRRNMHKLMIPHRLALKLVERGYTFREDIIWYKKNNVASSSKESLAQAYEFILFLSKNEKSYTNLDLIRVQGNEAREGRNKTPPSHLIQYQPINPDKKKIAELTERIHKAKPNTSFNDLPSTSEISWAYGYDPEKYCPTCYRKFKRHATRKRIGEHKHYPIFAVCNSTGKNPGNVWEISTKAHYGNEHFAIFPEDLVARIIKFASQKGDWVLDPFMGRGTTGVVCALTNRNFTGIDLYLENKKKSEKNITDAMEGKYDEKLAGVVAREMELVKSVNRTNVSNLETYLLTDGTLALK
jgi:DNA modification methylase